MREVVIINALRTPIGRHAGALSSVRADDLAALVIKAVVEDAGIDPGEIEEVYMGCANQAGEDNRNVARLRPVFRKGGTVTAGNSSGLNDGAAALLLMSAEKADDLGLEPMARWVASAAAGVDPRVMGLGPIHATRKVLQRAGLDLDEIDLIELNEAFAVQSLAVMHELGMRPEITNVNGGAIALGHPLGCSGARILTTLLHEMKLRAAEGQRMRHGLAALCVGVGQGEATIVEMS